MTCFENIVRTRRFIYPQFFFSGKVWENRFFLYCMTLVDPYSKLLLTAMNTSSWKEFRSMDDNSHLKYSPPFKYPGFRACLNGGGGPQVGEVTRLGGVIRLSIQSLIFI